jgi:hypothetical protein
VADETTGGKFWNAAEGVSDGADRNPPNVWSRHRPLYPYVSRSGVGFSICRWLEEAKNLPLITLANGHIVLLTSDLVSVLFIVR